MSIESDIEFYKSKKKEWLPLYRGQFALIKDGKLCGTFTKEEEAYAAGVKLFGNAEMLIQQVLEEDPVLEIPALFVGTGHAHV